MPCLLLTQIRMAIKKWVAVRMGVLYDSQMTNRKQGVLPARTPTPPAHSYWLPGGHI